MSATIIKEIPCPNCKSVTKAKLWTSVSASENPSIRNRIMDESLFEWQCPHCKYKNKLSYPMLYHDINNDFMIYLVPQVKQHNIIDKESVNIYPNLDIINKRLAENINVLKEKILIFENKLDDMAIEVTKLAISRVVEKKLKAKVTEGYFCVFDEETSHLGFVFFLKDRKTPHYQTTRISAYEKSLAMVAEYMRETNTIPGFLKIDKSWAAEVLEQDFSE